MTKIQAPVTNAIDDAGVEALALLAFQSQSASDEYKVSIATLTEAVAQYGALLDERTVLSMSEACGVTVAEAIGRRVATNVKVGPLAAHTWQAKIVVAIFQHHMGAEGLTPDDVVNMASDVFKTHTKWVRRALRRLIGIKANKTRTMFETAKANGVSLAKAAGAKLDQKLVEQLVGEFEQALLDALMAKAKTATTATAEPALV